MKKSFIHSALIISAMMLVTKIIGAVWAIPFYHIVGEEAGTLFAMAYAPYVIIITLSTIGIPSGISRVVSKYRATEEHDKASYVFDYSKKIMWISGVVSFLVVVIISLPLAKSMISSSDLFTPEQLATAMILVSSTLIIAPTLSALRGYMQGNEYATTSSFSQLLEQIVRVVFILITAWGVYNLLVISDYDKMIASVNFATFAAFIGALAALFYLMICVKRYKTNYTKHSHLDKATKKALVKELFAISIPGIITSLALALYMQVDAFLMITIINDYTSYPGDTIYAVNNMWANKITLIPVAIAMAISYALNPAIAYLKNKKDHMELQSIIQKTVALVFLIVIPMSLFFIANPDASYNFFYSYSPYAESIMIWQSIGMIFIAVFMLWDTILLSLGYKRIAIWSMVIGLFAKCITIVPLLILDPVNGAPISTFLGFATSCLFSIILIKRKTQINYFASSKDLIKLTGFAFGLTVIFMFITNNIYVYDVMSTIKETVIYLGVSGTIFVVLFGLLVILTGNLKYFKK